MSEVNLADFDVRTLRDAKGTEIVSAFTQLAKPYSPGVICQFLLAEVRKEAIRPRIFSIFLRWSKCPDVISQCLQQEDTSVYIRWLGVRHFGKALADRQRWKSTWDSVGSTQGVVDLLSRFSVANVKALTLAIGCCNRGQDRVEEREVAVEGLLQGLLPSHYPKSSIVNNDNRPLQEHYARMVTACSSDFVANLLDDRDDSNSLFRDLPRSRLLNTHWKLLRSRVDEGLQGQESRVHDVREFLEPLVSSVPSLSGTELRTTASMEFSLKVLHLRMKNPNSKSWPGMSEADIVLSLLSRSINKKREENKIHDLVKLSLQVLEVKPQTKRIFERRGLWTIIATRWGRMPKLYEDVLIRAFQLGLSGPQNSIGQEYLQTQKAANIPLKLSWDLLRLYCLHVPNKPIDIDGADEFRSLKGQKWPIALFYDLEKDKAIRFLKGLLRVQSSSNWLEDRYRGDSILKLSSVGEQHNINAILLLTHLQSRNEEALKRSQEAVADFKKKSAVTREQTHRALFAKAAAFFAIASGSLELYADVVQWQQRFVRDPLTIKTIFAIDAVNTIEGFQLLSGIPYDVKEDVSESIKWADIEVRVEEANDILMSFQEIQRIAKKEPSYHKGDWEAISSLFGQAVTTRADRARSLQEKLKASDADVYGSVWYKTLQMLGKLEDRTLTNAISSVKTLISTLPPELLATTTETLLEMDNAKRATKNRDDQDHLVEQLTYDALKHLAMSDQPELASNLILKTILERPDASSWHRYLLSIGFLKRLPAKSAERMLLSFATAIGEKLEEQSYVKVGENTTAPSLVKVTTVKYLAQILDNSEFISADATVDVLTELFRSGTHRDIRIATLESMLSMLNKLCSGTEESWSSNLLVERLLTAMESVIPVVGSINEGRPPREQDWQEAKETGKLPETFDHVADTLPPLLHVIMYATASSQYPALVKFQPRFVERILLPALTHSEDEHRRWISLFVAKHKVPMSVGALPTISFVPSQTRTMVLCFHELIPSDLLERYHKFVSFNLAISTSLKRFNARLRDDDGLQNKREVKHWLAIFGQDVASTIQIETTTLIDRIHSDWEPSEVADGITLEQIQSMIVDQASLVLSNYDENTSTWDKLVTRLRHPSHRTNGQAAMDGWTKTCKPVLQRTAKLISAKRAPEWQRNPDRHPSILPSANKLRFWLLPYPSSDSATADVESQCTAFAHEAREVIMASLSDSPLKAHLITQQALTISSPLTDTERIHIALVLTAGDTIPTESSQAQGKGSLDRRSLALALADVASVLIQDGAVALGRSKEARKGVRGLLERWQRSEFEELRERALEWRVGKEDLWKRVFEEGT